MQRPVPGSSTSRAKRWANRFPISKTTRKTRKPKSDGLLTPEPHDLTPQSVEHDLNAVDMALRACVFKDQEVRGCTLTIVPAIVESVESTMTTLNPEAPLAPLERMSPIYGDRAISTPGTRSASGSVDAIEPVQIKFPTDIPEPNEQQIEQQAAIEATIATQAKIVDNLTDQTIPVVPYRRVSFPPANAAEEPTHQQEIGVRELLVSEVVDIARHAIGELRNAYNRELQLLYMLEGNKRPKAFREYFGFKSTRAPRDTSVTTQFACLDATLRLPTAPVFPDPVRASISQITATAQGGTTPFSPAVDDLESQQNRDVPRSDSADIGKMSPAEKAIYTRFARENLQMMRQAIRALAQLSQGVKKYDNGQV